MPPSLQGANTPAFPILPEDVLEEVFSVVQGFDDKKVSLFACSLVSQTWRVLTLKWRFRCISLSIQRLHRSEYNLTDFLKCNPNICQVIREVNFLGPLGTTPYVARKPIGSEFVDLMMLLPAIEKLTIPGWYLDEAYFSCPHALHDDAGCLLQRPPLHIVLAASRDYPTLPHLSPRDLYRFIQTIGMVDTLTIKEEKTNMLCSLEPDAGPDLDTAHLPVLQLRSLVLGTQIVIPLPNPRKTAQLAFAALPAVAAGLLSLDVGRIVEYSCTWPILNDVLKNAVNLKHLAYTLSYNHLTRKYPLDLYPPPSMKSLLLCAKGVGWTTVRPPHEREIVRALSSIHVKAPFDELSVHLGSSMPMLHVGVRDLKSFIQIVGDIRRAAQKLVSQSSSGKVAIEVFADERVQPETLPIDFLEEMSRENVTFNSSDAW